MARAQSDTGSTPKSEASFASLGPTLLARKGGAKPAMRPQLAPLPDVTPVDADQLEDLGWNDMGEVGENELPAPKKAPKKAAKKAATKARRNAAPKNLKSTQKPAAKPARRAAFTLRLDADRHLKLRLAATMNGVSAQALVTEAIDAMFGEIEDLDALVSRMKRN